MAKQKQPAGGGNGPAVTHRDRILALAATLKPPAVYSDRNFIAEDGLTSYGPDRADQYRVAGYVDRILKGEKPAELPRRRQSSSRRSI